MAKTARSCGSEQPFTQHNADLADLAALRTAFVALLTKLDSNHGAATDHVATLTPAAITAETLTKGV